MRAEAAALTGLEDRVDAARRRCGDKLRRDFARAGLSYPAEAVLCRAFKHERQCELWATNDADAQAGFKLVGMRPILGASGTPGPKRQEGDLQVPEGFYRVTRFNPRSRFHLSLGLDYPNASDLKLATNPKAPGSDVFIHGGTVSRGCLAVGDTVMEEIYLIARDAREVHVHLFPCRMDASASGLLDSWMAAKPELRGFWRRLRAGYEHFEDTKALPFVQVNEERQYVFRNGIIRSP